MKDNAGFCACGCGSRTKLASRNDSGRGWVKGQPQKYVLGHSGVGHPEFKLLGQDNGMWKGDEVGYNQLHGWVRKHKIRTGICSKCGTKGKTEWANVSGEYRRDLGDFIEMCRSCHRRFDRARTAS